MFHFLKLNCENCYDITLASSVASYITFNGNLIAIIVLSIIIANFTLLPDSAHLFYSVKREYMGHKYLMHISDTRVLCELSGCGTSPLLTMDTFIL